MDEMNGTAPVRAAGGVVCRAGPGGLLEVAIIHRPTRDDWSLPKGKLEPGEEPLDAALREVEEETGMRCDLLEPVGETSYVDRKGRDKTVLYWLMRPVSGTFEPGDEVDVLRWLTPEEALVVMSYEQDRELISRVARECASARLAALFA
ncbi:MAG TPA: NUDIX hydrolase [Candidatus Dormibacteraeota bacterium]|jgi:8-oxo-dGTP diphosphatase|nr:NUDIX hydrolase [Candidatus Dormibacteraeota bacterium]